MCYLLLPILSREAVRAFAVGAEQPRRATSFVLGLKKRGYDMEDQSGKLDHQVAGLPSLCLASSRIQFSVHTGGNGQLLYQKEPTPVPPPAAGGRGVCAGSHRKQAERQASRAARRAPEPSALAALNSPNETDRKDARPEHRAGPEPQGENRMGRTLAAFVVAAALVTLASSEAAAWECRAVGFGSSGYARAYDIIDAKLFALRQCERRSPLPVCTLVWCHPGGSRIISTAPVTDMPRQGSPTGKLAQPLGLGPQPQDPPATNSSVDPPFRGSTGLSIGPQGQNSLQE